MPAPGLLVPPNDIVSAADKTDIPPKVWAQATSNGNTYCFPWYTETGHLALNMSLFKEAGHSAGGRLQSLRDHEVDTPAIQRHLAGHQGQAERCLLYPYNFYCGSTQGDTYTVMFLEMFGGSLLNENGSAVAINGPKGVQALEFLKSMNDEGLFAGRIVERARRLSALLEQEGGGKHL